VCGGAISFSTLSKGGKTGGTTNAKNKTGVCGRNKEKMLEDAKKGGKKNGRTWHRNTRTFTRTKKGKW
jgi:hypothetical protein